MTTLLWGRLGRLHAQRFLLGIVRAEHGPSASRELSGGSCPIPSGWLILLLASHSSLHGDRVLGRMWSEGEQVSFWDVNSP